MAGKKILVADDSLTIQKVIRLALSNEGYEIQAVSDGADAIQQISLFRPDAVLIDVSLPTQSAFEIKRTANSKPDLKNVKFVLMSSAFEKVDEAQATELHFDGRLTKPFDPAHLRQVLQEVLATGGAAGDSEMDFQDLPAAGPPEEGLAMFDPLAPEENMEPEEATRELSLDHEDADSEIELTPTTNPQEEPFGNLWEDTAPEDTGLRALDPFASLGSPPPMSPPPAPPKEPKEGVSIHVKNTPIPPLPPTPPAAPSGLDLEPPSAPSFPEDPFGEDPTPALDLASSGAEESPDQDIKNLTESTIRMSGLDDFQWSINETGKKDSTLFAEPDRPEPPALKPPVSFSDDGGSSFRPAPQTLPPGPHLSGAPQEHPAPAERAGAGSSLSSSQMEEIVRAELRQTLEKMAQKILPEVAEKIIKAEINKMLNEKI